MIKLNIVKIKELNNPYFSSSYKNIYGQRVFEWGNRCIVDKNYYAKSECNKLTLYADDYSKHITVEDYTEKDITPFVKVCEKLKPKELYIPNKKVLKNFIFLRGLEQRRKEFMMKLNSKESVFKNFGYSLKIMLDKTDEELIQLITNNNFNKLFLNLAVEEMIIDAYLKCYKNKTLITQQSFRKNIRFKHIPKVKIIFSKTPLYGENYNILKSDYSGITAIVIYLEKLTKENVIEMIKF